MKICTITCHDVYNHGASLQAYALMRYLLNEGNKVEIIDYKPDYLSGHYNIFSINNPKWEKNIFKKMVYLLLKVPTRVLTLKRKREFDNFREKYLMITSKKYSSNNELKNNLPNADAYICGSDQIWNSAYKNGRDEAFYLNFVPNEKIKLSYAASFAVDEIEEKYKDMVKRNVETFRGIGVREKSGVEILKRLGIERAVNVLDPVFLLDQIEWNKMAIEKFNERYVLVYDFDKNPLIEKMAKKIAKENNYKIYAVNSYETRYADKTFKYSGPEIFVSLIKNSEFVISNSFHSVVFSVIYEKEIAIVNRIENINTRMRDLLNLLGLEDRLITSEKDIELLERKINYKKIKIILKENIEFSKTYLLDTLKEMV